jgi:hydrogenase maturation factor
MSGPLDLDAGADMARAALMLARRFAAGATLWCLAPDWPEHSRHVAVEFVHPVVMGKRALPAVSITGADPVAELRSAAHAGDVLVVVAPAASPTAGEAVRRAPAWGLTTVWIGAGSRPQPAGADHLVWIDAAGPSPRHDGTLVLRYHVLWELTHVCFEHPGLLTDPAAACEDGMCVTCTDEGRPAEVATVLGGGLVAVRTARGAETVDASLVGDVVPGDLLLVHAGAAIERLAGDDG